MASSTRFRAPSLVIKLATWNLTVLHADVKVCADLGVVRPLAAPEQLIQAVRAALDGWGVRSLASPH